MEKNYPNYSGHIETPNLFRLQIEYLYYNKFIKKPQFRLSLVPNLFTILKKIIFDKNLLKSFYKIKKYEIGNNDLIKSKQMLGITFGNKNNSQIFWW